MAIASVAQAAPSECRHYLTASTPAPVKHSLSAEDLVRLRDLGSNGELAPDVKVVALSPDHRNLAFQLRRAEPDGNSYCLGMFVMELGRRGVPRLVDVGGEPIRMSYEFRGKAGFSSGIMTPITPQWTPDGKEILFLKQTTGAVQIWRAKADGSGSRAVTSSADDVVDFLVEEDGRAIWFRTRTGLARAREAIDQEGLTGFHFDDRFSPMTSNRPFARAPVEDMAQRQTLTEAGITKATKEQSPVSTAREADAIEVRGRQGQSAWVAFGNTAFPPPLTLHVRLPNGRTLSCAASVCDRHISNLWWTPEGRLRFFRREGWGAEATAIYEWMPGSGTPRRIFVTRDVLSSCTPVLDDIICVREASARPRYIARIGLPRGRETILFDPNPEFSTLRLGRIERLHWRNREGLDVFGDLVLPVGYRSDHRYPLVVVQYESRGFLRGGTGDEYPIQLFAAHGYAVLSFNRPPDIGLYRGARTAAEVERADLHDFADRRSVHSALEEGVARLFRRGIADPRRVGITGLSDGASSAQFALLNSSIFSAAAMSSCCWDSSLSWRVGPGSMRDFTAMGYPGVLTDANPFWDRISIAKNAARFRTPLLLQLADSEYVGALTAYTALRDHQAPVDLYVFPGETHIKWQPAHRLAIYKRNIAWFDFWLKQGISRSYSIPENAK